MKINKILGLTDEEYITLLENIVLEKEKEIAEQNDIIAKLIQIIGGLL